MIKRLIMCLILTIGVSAFVCNAEPLIQGEYLAYEKDTEPEFVDSATAQDMNGTRTKSISVYRTRTSNGHYRYFAYADGQYYTLYAIMKNKYKPYYFVDGNGTRWYFASRTLDTKGAYRDMPN